MREYDYRSAYPLTLWKDATLKQRWDALENGIKDVRYQRKELQVWEGEGGAISDVPVQAFVVIDSVG
jgi:hypothetical protein